MFAADGFQLQPSTEADGVCYCRTRLAGTTHQEPLTHTLPPQKVINPVVFNFSILQSRCSYVLVDEEVSDAGQVTCITSAGILTNRLFACSPSARGQRILMVMTAVTLRLVPAGEPRVATILQLRHPNGSGQLAKPRLRARLPRA